jgi:response regulator RpfG family c-di-GMP phosphodiesterase
MKKILIVEDDFDLRELLEIIIESEFENPIVSAFSGNNAIDILKNDIDIGLIVSDLFMPNGTGVDLFNYNCTAQNIPFLLITGDADQDKLPANTLREQHRLSRIVNKPWAEDDLLDPIREILCDLENVSLEDHEPLEYKRVSVNNVLNYQAFEFSYYIKQNDIEYIPLRECHSDMSQFLIENRESSLYLSIEDFDRFVKSSVHNLCQKTESIAKIADFFSLSASIIDLLAQGSQALNIQPEDLEKINKYVDKEFKQLSQKESLKELIESLKNGHGYLVGHTLIMIQVSSAIIKSMGFFEQSVLSKLIQASILHDIILEDDSLSSIVDTNNEIFSSLDEEKKKTVLDHPVKMSSLLETTQEYSADVIKMIRYHHILPSGNGFPTSLSVNNITLTCAIFNISLMASDIYYKDGFTASSKEKIVRNLKENYMLKEFKEVAVSLLDVLG